jgi:hypothetical protein
MAVESPLILINDTVEPNAFSSASAFKKTASSCLASAVILTEAA